MRTVIYKFQGQLEVYRKTQHFFIDNTEHELLRERDLGAGARWKSCHGRGQIVDRFEPCVCWFRG